MIKWITEEGAPVWFNALLLLGWFVLAALYAVYTDAHFATAFCAFICGYRLHKFLTVDT